MTWDIAGKRVVITGATTGIGEATGAELARRGALVTVLGRDPSRLRAVQFSDERYVMDLADLSTVRAAAHQMGDTAIDVLINNAGVAGVSGVTKDGFEMHFGTNYLGHAMLTEALMPNIRAGGRVINLTSAAHHRVIDWSWDSLVRTARGAGRLKAYAASKLANILFTRSSAIRFRHVDSVAVHPGLVATDIWRTVPAPLRPLVTRSMQSPTEGSRATLICATAPSVVSGAYYTDAGTQDPSPLALDDGLAAHLSDWTVRALT